MTVWTEDELRKIGTAEELEIATEHQRRRYRSIVPSIVAPEARAATLKLIPRSTSSVGAGT